MDECNVTFYADPPDGNTKFPELIGTAVDRLKLYGILKEHETLSLEDLKVKLEGSPLKDLLETNAADVKRARLLDYVSHWILKIAYSANHPRFFIENEMRWFRFRFNNMTKEDRDAFLARNNLVLTPATEEEKERLRLGEKWYKIHFTEIKDLVKKRLYPLELGYLYVPEHKIVYWLTDKFERKLIRSLDHCQKMFGNADQELVAVISLLELVPPYDYDPCNAPFTLSDLKSQVKHFPLCMQAQYETLITNHHLKHQCRLELGLFLKDLGLSLDDAIELFKTEFTKKISEERFMKDYLYYIKHQYGTVGSKIKYTAHSCDKILEDNGGPGGCGGCPFKKWDQQTLRSKVKSDLHWEEIRKMVEKQQYKAACTQYFKATHGWTPSRNIDHPIFFYKESCSGNLVDIEDLFQSDNCD